MVEQVRRIDAQYGLHLTEEEIQLIAREAAAAEKMLACLYEVALGQTRPIMGIAKTRRLASKKRGRK
ncbi:MAG: hypothetical protein HW419_4340 [Deltaproteobacteria bacterium]|nr:hypothetical protein [Deltaproteobacteria bacterium]